MQYKKNSNSRQLEETLKLKDVRPPSHKDPTVLRVVTDHPIPLCCSLYYYEVNVCAKSQCGTLKIGFTIDEQPTKHRNCVTFIGYNSNTGRISLYNRSNTSSDDEDSLCGPTFGEGDVIGCGLNFVSNSVFFTRNGIIVCSSSVRQKLAQSLTAPCVMLVSPTTALIGNFGQRDFAFAIDQHLAQERCNAVSQAIESKLTADLASVNMQSLVFDYLVRHGYLTTASAMARPAVDAPAQTSAIPATSCPSSPSTTSVPVDEDEAPSKDPPNSKLSPTLLHSNGLKYSISPRLKRWAKMWSLKDLFKSTSSSSSWSTPLRHRKATHDSTTDETDDAEAAKSSVASTDVESPSQQVWECGGGDRWPESPAEANQRIRLAELIRQGHYLQAISQLTKNYPSLIQAMPSIVFMLRCRYFIEMLFANQHPPTEANGDFTHKASPAKATSAPPNPDCRKAAKGTRTFKRTQPSSSPECSPCGGGGNCLRQSAALRRKCEVTNGSLNGGGSGNLVEGDDDDDEEGGLFKENLPVACAYQENGSIAVVQATRCVQNGVSTLTKEKTRAAAARSLFKCSSLTSVENTLEPPVQSGVVQQNAHVPSTVAMETRSTNDSPTPASDSSPLQQSPLDLNSVVQLGRELRDNARELQANNAISPTQLALLQDAFSLFAYENPYESPFSDLMHPKHRKMLAESVNNAILVKLGKARCSLLEIGIGLLEEAMLDDRVDGRLAVDTGDTKVHWKQHNQTSTSSAGSTPTPSHAASAAAAYPAAAAAAATLQSTVRIFAPSSSPRSNASSQYNRGHRRHHHSHHHHHRSTTTTTSALVVTSTSTSQTPAQAFPPGTPHSALIYQRSPSLSTSPAGRRLRNTIVQSSPHDEDGVVDHLQEASTSGGVDWGEEVAGDEVALNWDEALCVPPARSGLEMAGFFHPVFFVPRSKP